MLFLRAALAIAGLFSSLAFGAPAEGVPLRAALIERLQNDLSGAIARTSLRSGDRAKLTFVLATLGENAASQRSSRHIHERHLREALKTIEHLEKVGDFQPHDRNVIDEDRCQLEQNLDHFEQLRNARSTTPSSWRRPY